MSVNGSNKTLQLLKGAYDLHLHVAPDLVERRIDDISLAKEFLDNDFKGFVLKSHYYPTVERAQVVNKAVPGISVFGSVVLNHTVGGFNPVLVDIAGRSKGRIVWMPTFDAENEKAGRIDTPVTDKLPFWAKIQRQINSRGIAPAPLTVVDQNGDIRTDVKTCLELIAEYDMILATGHLSRDEIFALVPVAVDLGVRRIIITHALYPAENLSVPDQVALSEMGAFIEHSYTTFYTNKASWDLLFESVKAVGSSHCILSTDLGQTINPPVSAGLVDYANRFLDVGFTLDDVRTMMVENTMRMVEPDLVPRRFS
ncbi:DUF6282 family protein [Alicyclobacillus sp. ALC3]|uniref:DUF6282 family protein n=1 Tax=Alicyclobacillus sp. ALC3 TaxID=2796143 RepID=UPI002378B2DD|nr:DUF6282 family protein [Alicyclobacillus sp. ALC3]WDL99301.1 cytosolic protein [Alicyclobacillus sp. ALC3]